MANWKSLTSEQELNALKAASFERPQLIFKHSTRCGISAHVLHVLEEAADRLGKVADLHYLDLIAHRPISNKVATKLQIPHQSPQVILLKEGEVVHNASHFSIEPENVVVAAKA